MEEIWKDIEGYEGLYQVSNFGRVKSLERTFERFNGHITIKQKVAEKILNTEKTRWGYLRVHLYKEGLGKKYVIHRLVAQAFIPNPENKPEVNHIDGNKLNNKVENLEWVTSKENIIHSYKTGLIDIEKKKKCSVQNLKKAQEISKNFWGEKIHTAKLKEKDVLEIRRAYDNKEMTNRELADKYGLEIHSIARITSRKTWTKIP